jgi:hypothetical protein
VNDSGLGSDEIVLPAAFMFLEEPTEVSEPRVSGNLFNVSEQAGVLVVLSPTLHNCIQGSQPAVFVHPCPTSGSQVLEFLLDSLFALLCRSEMHYPGSFGFASLDMKSKKVKPIIEVGKERLFFGQFEVKLSREKVSNFLFCLLYSWDTVVA